MNRRKNNKGFTLVELILAMTVLAIIVIPLLRAFVASALTNNKAAKVQRATACAQNFIENLKSSTVSDMALSVYGYSADEKGKSIAGFPVSSFTGKDSSGGSTEISAFEATSSAPGLYIETNRPCVTETTLGGKFRSPDTEGEKLCFVFPNVTQNGKDYDIVLDMESGKVSEEVTAGSMSKKTCLYFAQPNGQADEAASRFETANTAYANKPGKRTALLNKNQFEQRMKRTVTMDIVPDGSSVKVTLTADYYIDPGYTENDERHYTVIETSVHDNTDGGLASVYYFFYPLYDNSSNIRDSFVINNTEDLDLDIYLISMENTDYSAENMMKYRSKVTVKEKMPQTEYQGANARTEIHTGLMSNVESGHWTVDDQNTYVNTAVRSLGVSDDATFMYRLTLTVYEHDDDAFVRNDGKTTFLGSEDRLLTSFEGSALD